jgi:pyruvate formate lyase activating enzyme
MEMKEAILCEKLEDGSVRCDACSHRCRIAPAQRGVCGVRENRDGVLYALSYGKVITQRVDPVGKKSLFHVQPETECYSLATVGCNFKCVHCQNWEISQYPHEQPDIAGRETRPEEAVEEAVRGGCRYLAFTYTEPTVFLEYALDCARLAVARGLGNLFISNGYATPESARAFAPYVRAINIDLKGDDAFYREVCGARLAPVLENIRLMRELGVWVEVSTLVIPGMTDGEEFLRWAADFLVSVDPAIPWHLGQFFPMARMPNPQRTPLEVLVRAREIGKQAGLKYVYESNDPGSGRENTLCPVCNAVLVRRVGFTLSENRIRGGTCPDCSTEIAGVWSE